MSGDPILLIASHPTRGVDVGAQAQIWDHIREARREGLAVLLISADLDELIGLSDTIQVILRGRLVGTFDPRTVTPQELGSAMTGAGDAGSEPRQARRAGAGGTGARLRRRRRSSPPWCWSRTGDDVAGFWGTLLTWPENRNIVNILNAASILYLSGIAAAIGFRMNLFNIGVEGQYRIGDLRRRGVRRRGLAARASSTPSLAILVAMARRRAVGRHRRPAAGHPRRQRGDLDDHAERDRGSLVGYLLGKVGQSTGNSAAPRPIAEDSWVGGITIFGDSPTKLYGLALLAVVVGIAF